MDMAGGPGFPGPSSFRKRWQLATRGERAALVALALLLGFALAAALAETFTINDFEVFQMAGHLAWERDPGLYAAKSPEEGRRFLYPPGAAILLMPMGVLPGPVAIVAWSALKIAALLAIVLLGARLGGPGKPRRWPLAALAALLLVFRPVDSDIANGQVNLLVLALALVGVWMLLGQGRGRWWGVPLAAVAVALKMTPALLLAALVLRRRWAELAACLLAIALLMVALPRAWFGAEALGQMRAGHRATEDRLWLEAKNSEVIASFYEIVLFTAAQAREDPAAYVFHDGVLKAPGPDGKLRRARMPPMPLDKHAKALWLAIGLLVGAAFLATRQMVLRGRPSLGWDLAMLALLIPLLSPLVRKAYLVAALPGAAWAAMHLLAWAREHPGGWRAWPRRVRVATALLLAAGTLFWASNDVYIPVPGFPMPLHFAHFLGAWSLLALLVLLGAREAREAGGSP